MLNAFTASVSPIRSTSSDFLSRSIRVRIFRDNNRFYK